MKKPLLLSILLILIQLAGYSQDELFNSSWASLDNYKCPDWFRDAKFGIWTCWNAYTVPAAGDWYARHMYVEGHRQYKHHVENYGHPSEFGYKDIIPLWKGENFQPDSLVALFQEAGAKYIVAPAMHHDNFDLWDSRHHEWNSVNYGPKQNIIGKWEEAVRKSGLHWGITTHLARAWCWFQTSHGSDKDGSYAGIPYDGNDPAYESLYFETHDNTSYAYPVVPADYWPGQWFRRVKDLVDQHEPDLLYFDGGIPFGETGREMMAYYYNSNMKRNDGHLEGVLNIKNYRKSVFHGDFRYGVAVEDVERGRLKEISQLPWQTDTSIGDWFWTSGDNYDTPKNIIDQLVDIVSKNGNLLLNVPPRADGTLDDEAIHLLKEIGAWLRVNGEGIYGSRPYTYFGEGPTTVEGGHFSKMAQLTAEDYRYTTKGDTIFAFVCGEPEAEIRLESFSAKSYHRLKSVEMLGVDPPLQFSQTEEALVVAVPDKLPSKYAICIRIIPLLVY